MSSNKNLSSEVSDSFSIDSTKKDFTNVEIKSINSNESFNTKTLNDSYSNEILPNKGTDAEEEEKIKLDHWYDGFIRLFIWYPKTLSPQESKLLLKLDICLLSYVCASYFTKSLDKSNIMNAYSSGMEEDIHFDGNDFAYAKSIYSAGYIISMCFGIIFVTRPWSRYMLPVLEVIWGILTFCQATVTNPTQMFAIRFLIGLAEGPVFCSIVHILGSWYKRDEVYRRVMAFSISSSVGSMFSGYLQNATYVHLSGVGGLSGWKWGFIIDGVFTVPIALIGFLVFPGAPYQVNKIWWLSKQELQTAKDRANASGIASPGSINFKLFKDTVADWKIHFFTAFWVLLNIVSLPDGTALQLWLKDNPDRFSVEDRNNYPTIQSAVGIVAQFFLAGLSDSFSIYPFLTITQCLFIISYSSLAAWKIPDAWRWICFMIIGFDTVDQSIISGWINRSCRHNNEQRALVLGYSDAVSQVMNIWTNIVFYPTSSAPEFRIGFVVSTISAGIMLIMPLASHFLERRDARK